MIREFPAESQPSRDGESHVAAPGAAPGAASRRPAWRTALEFRARLAYGDDRSAHRRGAQHLSESTAHSFDLEGS